MKNEREIEKESDAIREESEMREKQVCVIQN